jgi:signal transduction protein with GAF and PtsI domain
MAAMRATMATELQVKLRRESRLERGDQVLDDGNKLEEACRPVPGFEEAYRELVKERRKDEERARRKYGF